MKKTLFTLLLVAALMLGITGSAFAAGPAEYTIDVRQARANWFRRAQKSCYRRLTGLRPSIQAGSIRIFSSCS